jgi:hypothetical protein
MSNVSFDLQNALLLLYPLQDEDEVIEKRLPAEIPSEHVAHRIHIKCVNLK